MTKIIEKSIKHEGTKTITKIVERDYENMTYKRTTTEEETINGEIITKESCFSEHMFISPLLCGPNGELPDIETRIQFAR